MGVLLITNTSKPHALEAARSLARALVGRGIAVHALSSDIAEIGLDDLRSLDPVSAETSRLRLVVALGGDGTILRAVHTPGMVDVPILGVKLGRLGFLSGTSQEAAVAAVLAALDGSARIDERSTVRVRIASEDGSASEMFGLNEVVVARGSSGRVIGFTVSVSGESVATMRGDGVLVATATGSTGYALSAGGPVVAPGFPGLVVVPIAPHTLNARSLVTDVDDAVRIDLGEDQRGDAIVFIDGEPVDLPSRPIRVDADSSGPRVRLVRHDSDPFYRAVSRTFFGGA